MMNLYVPLDTFGESAEVLSTEHLKEQALYAWAIFQRLTRRDVEFKDKRALLMWSGAERGLALWGTCLSKECSKRGHALTFEGAFIHFVEEGNRRRPLFLPPWLGEEEIHASHRSNLLRLDPAWYGQFGWSEPPDLPYIWP